MRKKSIWIATGTLVAISAALEIVFRDHAHAVFWWQFVPAFDFAYGFLGCVVIVLGSKWLGHRLLQRREDYYDR